MALDKKRAKVWRVHHSGVQIYMYRDEPGVFRNIHGKEVSAKLAREVGYDVDDLLKERAIREAKERVSKKIEQEMRAAIEVKEVEREEQGYKLVRLGKYRKYHIEDDKGNVLTPMPLPEDEAVALFEGLLIDDAADEGETAKADADAEAKDEED